MKIFLDTANLEEIKKTLIAVSIASLLMAAACGLSYPFFFERYFDLHLANRLIPCLLPLGLLALLVMPASSGGQVGVVLFVLLYGLGNGMLTIVKGTAIAQYVNRDHVATLNGVLGLPLALARAGAPLMVGLLWTPVGGYTQALWLLLVMSLVGVGALMLAQRHALAS